MAHVIHGSEERTLDVDIHDDVTFTGLCPAMDPLILNGLIRSGYIHPSPIQIKSIPLALMGMDLVVQSKSGTGKTLVFVIASLQTVISSSTLSGVNGVNGVNGKSSPLVIIVAPTREIALQIHDVFKSVARLMLDKIGIKTFMGGVDIMSDKKSLKSCHVAIGTPGRLEYLIGSGVMDVSRVKLLVLDESDQLMDGNFIQVINEIYSRLPVGKQMMVTSATYPLKLSEFLAKYMRSPEIIMMNSDDPSLIGVKQYYLVVNDEKDQSDQVLQIFQQTSYSQSIIFCNNQLMLVHHAYYSYFPHAVYVIFVFLQNP